MSDKYPHQSNYVYCSNNPIKIIDPHGEDEWDLAQDGTMAKRKDGRTDVDIVHGTDKEGNAVSAEFEKGTINIKRGGGKYKDGYNKILYTTYDYLEIQGDEKADKGMAASL